MEAVGAGEEEADEWLLQSLRLYGDLHTFELQAPTRLIEWARGNRVCVAGYGQSGGNEILQLLPPPSLQVKETQGLCPERDFKVECGGFSNRPVYSLKYVPDTSLLVTSGPPDSSLQVWQVSAEDSASRSSEELGGLAFLDPDTLLLCSAEGRLFLADLRQPRGPLEAASIPWAPCGERWCMGVGHGPPGSDLTSQPIVCLSSGGHLTLTDVRKTSESLATVKCRVPSASSSGEFLCVSWAPALESCLAVSGFDGTVRVFDTWGWEGSGLEVEPIFVHRGHALGGCNGGGDLPLVTTHTWHPQKARTLLSAASDGSLHVWDWVQPGGDRG
ncbi:PREDICTED: WD repeat-containing protein 73 isoform X3 [Calidris pugnax]|uniref:WD repeat-containing protein 73 isoform X3 n=1 Tax=Calidris pugnax TaxID=198806 RepID=UPI00071D7793|nr:PREDICTED: WD repeat-containing protein 73 isoform X3 [Calidris pugnax]